MYNCDTHGGINHGGTNWHLSEGSVMSVANEPPVVQRSCNSTPFWEHRNRANCYRIALNERRRCTTRPVNMRNNYRAARNGIGLHHHVDNSKITIKIIQRNDNMILLTVCFYWNTNYIKLMKYNTKLHRINICKLWYLIPYSK